MSDDNQNVAEGQEATTQAQQEENKVEETTQVEGQTENNQTPSEEGTNESGEGTGEQPGETSGEGTPESNQEEPSNEEGNSGEQFQPEPEVAPADNTNVDGEAGGEVEYDKDKNPVKRPETLNDEVVGEGGDSADGYSGQHDMGQNPPAMTMASEEETDEHANDSKCKDKGCLKCYPEEGKELATGTEQDKAENDQNAGSSEAEQAQA